MKSVLKAFLGLIVLGQSLSMAQDLPKRMPYYMDTSTTKESLKKWAHNNISDVYYSKPEKDGWSEGFNFDSIDDLDSVTILKLKRNNQNWIAVFFKLDIYLIDKDIDQDLVLGQIYKTLHIYNEAGEKIRVDFTLLSTKFHKPPFTEDMGIDPKTLQTNSGKLSVIIAKKTNPFWNNQSFNKTAEDKRSFIDNISMFLNYDDLSAFTHELNHLLLRNDDAYAEPGNCLSEDESACVSFLNAKNCRSPIDPIEIYMGLKYMGYEAPGWYDYVKSVNAMQPMPAEPKEDEEVALQCRSVKPFQPYAKKSKKK